MKEVHTHAVPHMPGMAIWYQMPSQGRAVRALVGAVMEELISSKNWASKYWSVRKLFE